MIIALLHCIIHYFTNTICFINCNIEAKHGFWNVCLQCTSVMQRRSVGYGRTVRCLMLHYHTSLPLLPQFIFSIIPHFCCFTPILPLSSQLLPLGLSPAFCRPLLIAASSGPPHPPPRRASLRHCCTVMLRPVHTYAALRCVALVLVELVETEKCFYEKCFYSRGAAQRSAAYVWTGLYSAVYFSNAHCWIGLFKSEPEAWDNVTYWLDGNPSTYRNWYSYGSYDIEPNSAGQCVRIYNGTFRDISCFATFRYVCKGRPIYFLTFIFSAMFCLVLTEPVADPGCRARGATVERRRREGGYRRRKYHCRRRQEKGKERNGT